MARKPTQFEAPQTSSYFNVLRAAEDLFAGIEVLSADVRDGGGYLMLKSSDLSYLNPTFPGEIGDRLLCSSLIEQPLEKDRGRSRFAQRILRIMDVFSDSSPEVEFSQPFTFASQRFQATDPEQNLRFNVNSVAYQGTVRVGKQVYTYTPEEKVITASVAHSLEPGQAQSRALYIQTPHIPQPIPRYDGSSEGVPLFDLTQSWSTNMLLMIAAAKKLK